MGQNNMASVGITAEERQALGKVFDNVLARRLGAASSPVVPVVGFAERSLYSQAARLMVATGQDIISTVGNLDQAAPARERRTRDVLGIGEIAALARIGQNLQAGAAWSAGEAQPLRAHLADIIAEEMAPELSNVAGKLAARKAPAPVAASTRAKPSGG